MTPDDARKAVFQVQEDILTLLRKLQDDTELRYADIDVDTIETMGGAKIITGVKVRMQL